MYVVISIVLFYALPAIMLVYLNLRIYCILRRSGNTSMIPTDNRRQNYSDRKVANNVAIIVLIFFACNLPFRVTSLWFTFEDKDSIYELGLEKYLLLVYSSRICLYLNHAINPLIYNFVSTKFRASFLNLTRHCCGYQSVHINYHGGKRRATLQFNYTSSVQRTSF